MLRPRKITNWREFLPLTAVVAFGVLLAGAAFLLLRAYSFTKEQEQFRHDSTYYGTSLKGDVGRYLNSLAAIRAFVTSAHVTRWEFSTYAHQVLPQNRGLETVFWIPHIKDVDRAGYEAALQSDGLYGLSIHSLPIHGRAITAGHKEIYLPITYVEPSENNLDLVGVDAESIPQFASVFDNAVKTKQIAASNPSNDLVEFGAKDLSIILAYPLLDERGTPLGYTVGIVRPAELIDEAMGPSRSLHAAFAYRSERTGQIEVSDGGRVLSEREWSGNAGFHQFMPIAIGNHQYLMAMRSTGHVDPLRSFYLPAGTSLLVIALTGLLVQNMSNTLSKKRAVERAVVLRTAELSLANRSLTLEIDQRRSAEEALRIARDKAESASRAKSAFLATMSHELRTPLNSVIGFSSVLKADQRLPPDCADHASEIMSNGRRLLGLVNDILDFTQMLTEEPGQHSNLVYLTDIIPAAVENAEQHAAQAGLTLTQSYAEDLPPIMGDSKRVSRALVHLLDNAVKFNTLGGTVFVAARLDEQCVVVEVSDTGVGIPVTALARIRESFSQCDLRLDRRYEGTGLGLAYVARVSELHGAKFEIVSEPEKGTLTRIIFASTNVAQVLEVA